MANSSEYPTFGSFGVISGVMVKISDKFLPPAKVSLPVGFKTIDPTDLLQFQYDFSKEKEAVHLAEEERLNLLRQLQEREEEVRLLEEHRRLLEEEKEKRDKEEEELQMQIEHLNINKELSENQDSTASSPPVTRSVSEILTPLVVTDSKTEQTKQNTNTIDVLEFESQNQNPFELVELQTLNELDELRSVLEPGVNSNASKHAIKSVPDNDQSSSGNEFELSSLFFKALATESVANTQDQNTANIISITDTPPHSTQNIFLNNTFGSVPQYPNTGIQSWTQFETNNGEHMPNSTPFHNSIPNDTQSNNVEFKNHLGNLLSKTPPPNLGYKYSGNTQLDEANSPSRDYDSVSPRQYENVSAMHRTKSLPNLQECTDYENVDTVTFNRSGPSSLEAKYSKSQEEQQQQQLQQQQQQYPTERIENIMKQYNFQRISNNPAVSASQQNGPTTDNNNISQNQYSNPIYAQVILSSTSNSFPVTSANFNTPASNYANFPPPVATTAANSYIATAVSSVNPVSNFISPVASSSSNQSMIYTPSQMPSASSEYSYVPPYMTANVNNGPAQQPTRFQAPLQSMQQQQPKRGLMQPSLQSPYYPTTNLNASGPMMVHSRPINQNDWSNEINLTSNTRPPPPQLPASTGIANTNLSLPPSAKPNSETQNQNHTPILPPISAPNRVFPVSPFGAAPNTGPPPIPFPRQPMSKPPTKNQPVPPRRPKSACLAERDLKTSPNKPLPTIPNHFSSNSGAAPSFLPDLTTSLSTSEKTFARQLNAMGFPLPLVSRAIKRLGMDDKEVLDFLVLVQEIKESGHSGDDVEMALIHNENDKTKTKSYLEMVVMFKEYGFQAKNIHDALKETSCDQNQALDVLTR